MNLRRRNEEAEDCCDRPVHRKNVELRDARAEGRHTLVENLAGSVNFLLAGQEQQDIPLQAKEGAEVTDKFRA